MDKNKHLFGILQLMEIEDDVICELQERIEGLNSPEDAESCIQDLEGRIEKSTAAKHFEETPYYLLLLAYCHFYLNNNTAALEKAFQASEKFRIAGDSIHQAFSRWVLAIIYRYTNRIYDYRNELDNAIKILKAECEEYQIKGEYTPLKRCREVLEQVQEEHAYATDLSTQQIMAAEANRSKRRPKGGTLIIPWFPVYNEVRASLTGIELIEAADVRVGISELTLDGRPFDIHVLRKTSPTDRQTHIKMGERVSLIKVIGHSMNACQPVSIEENDYVVFVKGSNYNDGNIVVAAYPAPSRALIHIVKRYKAADNTLVSETRDTSQPYPPIKIGPQHKILGTVIAVAKPAKD